MRRAALCRQVEEDLEKPLKVAGPTCRSRKWPERSSVGGLLRGRSQEDDPSPSKKFGGHLQSHSHWVSEFCPILQPNGWWSFNRALLRTHVPVK